MIPSNQLFELIRTLTKAEKRSFKLMCSLQGIADNKIFIRLFDKLDGMKIYDEKLVKLFFKEERFVKQLTSTKYYLYQLILRSLNRSSETKSLERSIESMIRIIPILYQKKLFVSIQPLIKKIKKQASEHELYLFLLEGLSWEEKLMNHLPNHLQEISRYTEIIKEKSAAIKKIENRSVYQNLRAQVFGFIKEGQKGGSSQSFNKKVKNILPTIASHPPVGLRSKCDMHYSLGVLFFYKKEYVKSYSEFKTLLEILDKNEFLKNDITNYNYFYAAQNCLATAIHLALYDSFVKNLTTQLKENYKDDHTNYLAVLRLELAVLIKASKFDRAISLIESNQQTIKHIDQQEYYILADFLFGAVQAYFWKEKYEQSRKWINKITTLNKQNFISSDIYVLTRLIEILINIELKNDELAISYLNSLNRQIEKETEKYSIEKIIVLHLLNYLKKSTHQKQMAVLKKLQIALKQPKIKPAIINLQNSFNFSKWLVKKINSR